MACRSASSSDFPMLLPMAAPASVPAATAKKCVVPSPLSPMAEPENDSYFCFFHINTCSLVMMTS